MLRWLRARGFRLIQGSANRLTLSVRAPRAVVARAFRVRIRDYLSRSGRRFYANAANPALPARLAPLVEDVGGLTDLGGPSRSSVSGQAEVRAAVQSAGASPQGFNSCTNKLFGGSVECTAFVCGLIFTPPNFFGGNLIETLLNVIFGSIKPLGLFLIPVCGGMYVGMGASGVTCMALGALDPNVWKTNPQCADFAQFGFGGPGSARRRGATFQPKQKIGLLEFDTFNRSDVSDWLAQMSGAGPLAGLSEKPVNGGVGTPGAGESEVLLDIDATMLFDTLPGTGYVVYDAPSTTTFSQVFQAMIADGDTVISNSWAQCEDQTSLADAQGIDSVLAQAAAAGISVYNSSGDGGSTCLDGTPNTISVPADSPHATAVGGSSATPGPGLTYGSEVWWDGSAHTPATGQGGFGVSRYFARPSYQTGFTGSAMRSVPDVVTNADPAQGFQICQADAGGCPSGGSWGGTSMAAPVWAAMTAVLNESTGHELGEANPALYPLHASPAFHSAASMHSDFAHVGLGSFDFEQLRLAIGGGTVGAVSDTVSVAAGAGPSPTSADQVPADGTSKGIVQVILRDGSGDPVSGKTVTLSAAPGSSAAISPAGGPSNADGDVTFTVTDTAVEDVTFTATGDGVTLADRPSLDFVSPSAAGATITASPTSVANDGTSQTTVSVYLQDSLGRPASGKTVSLSQNGHAIVSPGTQATTGSDGVATFSATDTSTEAVSFTAVDVTDGNLPVPGVATVNFQPAGPPTCSDALPAGSSPYTVRAFATGFPAEQHPVVSFRSGVTFTASGCRGAMTPTWDASGNMYVPDEDTGQIYVFGPGGGAADTGTALPATTFEPNTLGGLAFGKHGELWAAVSSNTSGVVQLDQLDPATGAVQRVAATITSNASGKYHCPSWMAVDPLSGDIFATDECGGSYASGVVLRISNPDSSSPTVSDYVDLGTGACGITFAPDGTMYVAVCGNGNVESVTGTNAGTPTATTVTNVANGVFGLGVASTGAGGAATSLYLTTLDGLVHLIDLTQSPATVSTIATGGGRLWTGAIGPDGCFYIGDVDQLVKLTGGTGCSTAPTAEVTLAATGAGTQGTGTEVTYTAHLSHFSVTAGTPVEFSVRGPNTQLQFVHADTNGNAAFTMTGILTGRDRVTASAPDGTTTVTSAPVVVQWTTGKDVTSLDLNQSQLGGPAGSAARLTASLTDVSRTPAAPVPGATVTLGLQGRTCTAVTDATGAASCSVTPSSAGLTTQTAGYAGDSSLTASATSSPFQVGPPVTQGPPVNHQPPVISGTPGVGDTLSCSTGVWTNAPSRFSYQWNRHGPAIPGATSPSYTVAAADQGSSLTCAVVASNAFGSSAPATSAPVSVPGPPNGAPVNTSRPAIAGTPTPGHTLTCSPGGWTNSPTRFAYQWARDGVPIGSATSSGYQVQIADEARSLTCTVIASNATGSGMPATSGAVIVALPNTLGCPKPFGTLRGSHLGPLRLGMTRVAARRTLPRFGVTHNNFDNFCLYAGWGIRAGYPSAALLRSLPGRRRGAVRGRIILALTANPFFALHGVRPGARVSAVRHRLHLGKAIRIGSNSWYVVRAGSAAGVLKVRHGVIQEVGIANRRLTAGSAAQSRFLRSFRKA